MKTTCTFYFILLLAISNQGLYAQTDFVKVWDARYGGDNIEVLTSFERTGDGGFILGGYSSSGISGNKTEAGRGGADYWIVKLDASGNLQWEKTYGGTADDFCYTVKPTRDGGYLIGGQSFSDSSADKTVNSFGGSDYWIIKTDSLGQYQWDNVYGGSDNEVLYNVLSVDGFNYALAGYSYSGSSGNKTDTCFGMKDFWILEIEIGRAHV